MIPISALAINIIISVSFTCTGILFLVFIQDIANLILLPLNHITSLTFVSITLISLIMFIIGIERIIVIVSEYLKFISMKNDNKKYGSSTKEFI